MYPVWLGRKWNISNMNEMQSEPRLSCDYVTSRNSYCKRVITSTSESKRVFFLNHKLQTQNEDECPIQSLLLIDLAYVYI